MVQEGATKLLPSEEMEVALMAELLCRSCRGVLHVSYGNEGRGLRGSVLCVCGAETGVVVEHSIVSWVAGPSSYGSLNPSVTDSAKKFYSEAETCSLAAAPNAVACMCRAAIEIALDGKGISSGNLNERINKAHTASPVLLGTVEVGLAHASRLVTNGSIHGDDPIKPEEVPSLLSAAIRVLNALYPN